MSPSFSVVRNTTRLGTSNCCWRILLALAVMLMAVRSAPPSILPVDGLAAFPIPRKVESYFGGRTDGRS